MLIPDDRTAQRLSARLRASRRADCVEQVGDDASCQRVGDELRDNCRGPGTVVVGLGSQPQVAARSSMWPRCAIGIEVARPANTAGTSGVHVRLAEPANPDGVV